MTHTAAATRQIVYVIPCGGEKRTEPSPARALYTGRMFAHTLAAAEKMAASDGGRVLILSALYGLVELDTVIAPYDQRMDQPGAISVEHLAGQAAALGLVWDDEATPDVYALLPKAYFAALDAALRTHDVYAAPVYEAAPGIGYQRRVNCNATRAW